MTKLYLLGAAVILLLASAFGAVTAFSRPAQAAVPEKLTLLKYEQQGSFGYEALVRAGAFYGNAAAAETIPQVPVSYIERFDMDFSFTSNKEASRILTVDARLENPGLWAKTVSLVPAKQYTGNFRASFPIDLAGFQQISDTINKELGATSTAYSVTLTAAVSGEGGLTQSLLIKVTKYAVDIDEELLLSQGGSTGKFEYRIKLRENSLYGPVTLTAPASLLNPALMALGPKDTVLARLLEGLIMDFDYRLSADKDVSNQSSRVKVTAVLENAGVWAKSFVLVPETTVNGPIHMSFPVDIAYFTGLFDTIQKEAGVSGASALTITASVHTEAQTEAGPVIKDFTQAVKTDLKKAVLAWEGGLQKTEPGTIEGSRVVMVENNLIGLPVSQARVIFGVAAGLALILFVFAMLKAPVAPKSPLEELAEKYKDIIVEAGEMPASREGESVVRVKSLDDLIKTSQGLLKPVLHRREDGKQLYWVSDGATRYQFMDVASVRKRVGGKT